MAELNIDSFEIHLDVQDWRMNIDIAKTMEICSREVKIIDNCSCEDCQVYVSEFIKKDLEIFRILSSVGVDLEKNVKGQPGVWYIQDDNGNFCYCEQECFLSGSIVTPNISKFTYRKEDQGMLISACFAQTGIDSIHVYLTFELEEIKPDL